MLSRFPISDTATALAIHTAGWPVSPSLTYHEQSGKNHLTWWVDRDPAGASGLLLRFHDPIQAKNLQQTDPDHPFLAARHGIEALITLQQWLLGGTGPPAIQRTLGPLLRCLPPAGVPPLYDLQRHVWDGLTPAIRVDCPAYAAALIVCGFPCYPQLCPPTGDQPAGFAFPAASLTFPGLREEDLRRTIQPGAIRLQPLPGYAMGEHPFDYAHCAAHNLLRLPAARCPAEKNPTIFIKGEGTGGVIASRSLLEESCKNSSFRDRAWEFLS